MSAETASTMQRLPDEYLVYANRHRGMDQQLYAWSNIFERDKFLWPHNRAVAVAVVIVLEKYCLTQKGGKPFRPDTAPGRPYYPDYPQWSWRDYGPRVGVFRLLDACAQANLSPAVVVPGELTRTSPTLVEQLVGAGAEIVGTCPESDDVLARGIERDEETRLVQRSLAAVRGASGLPVTGWMSPGQSESDNTLSILAENGVSHVLDWSNDDLPVRMGVGDSGVYSVPAPWDLSDAHQFLSMGTSPREYGHQLMDEFHGLSNEAVRSGTGRVLSVILHAWLSGHPSRSKPLAAALRQIGEDPHAWAATPRSIVDTYASAMGEMSKEEGLR